MRKLMVNKLMPLMIAVLTAVMSLMACKGGGGTGENNKKKMSEDNPLYALEEVRELNGGLEAPFLFGAEEEELKKGGFEAMENGILNHLVTYRCRDAKDVIYTVGTRELHYGEPPADAGLYVTDLRILPAAKTIQRNEDGTTTPVYETTRSVHGIKVGDIITEARQKLIALGYEPLFEETFKGGLPKTLDNTYKKGAVMITLGAESALGDISQIRIRLPYDDAEIDKLNEKSRLPVELGDMYSILMNPAFSYVQNSKTNVTRTYSAQDGSVAIMRGFPDYRDAGMTAEVSFVSDEYDVLGARVGMSAEDAERLLIAGGCTEDEGGLFIFNSVSGVRLTVENGVVTGVAACLLPSTNLSNIEIITNNK